MNTINKQSTFLKLLFLWLRDVVVTLNFLMAFWNHMIISSSFELVLEHALPISLAPILVLVWSRLF